MTLPAQELSKRVSDNLAKNSVFAVPEGPKTNVEESEIDFEVTNPDSVVGVLSKSNLYQISVTMLWAMRLIGRLPYSLGSDGWMKSSFNSIPFFYCVAILIVNVGLHVYYHDHLTHAYHNLSGSITFSRILFSTIILAQTLGLGMTVFSWIFENKFIVRNFNSTAVLEKKLGRLIAAPTVKPTTVTILKNLLCLFFICEPAVSFILLAIRYKNEPIPVLIMFAFNFLGNQSYTVMWCVSNLFYRNLASQLENHVKKSLQMGGNRARKLKECRKAWISIWEQSQNNSNAFPSTIIINLVFYSITFVTSCYGLIVSIKISDYDEVLGTFPFFFWTLLLAYSIIETTHQVKNKLGDRFLTYMIHLDKDNMDSECLEEVGKLTSVILQTDKAQFTLKGYLVIGRPLFVSFLSYTVTYLIVMLQFKQTEEQARLSQNSTFSW